MTRENKRSRIDYNPPRIKGGGTKATNYRGDYSFVFTGEVRGLINDTKNKENEKDN